MTTATKNGIKKRRGRPATGQGVQIGERWHEVELAAIDAWIAKSGEELARAEAVRRLVAIALGHSKSGGPTSAKSGERAKRLAAKTIDRLIHPAATADEAASRKRRLLLGPEEFREVRVDRGKET
jgi:hypothetical protein